MADDIAVTHELAAPIKVAGEEVTKLEFRRPTGKDVLHVGNPVRFNPASPEPIETMRFDWPVLADMIVRLTGVPLSAVETIPPSELTTIAWRVAPFFLPRP